MSGYIKKGDILFVAGLTGGIATGKSTVSKIFKDAGAVLIDADQIAHTVVKKGEPAWQKIKKYFGDQILLPDKEINRELLGSIIFHDAAQKKVLNKIVHPFVTEKMAEDLLKIKETRPDSIVILDVPLLIEAGMVQDVSDVILVYIPEILQMKRLIARDNISETDAKARIISQMPIDEKKNFASILIDNSKSFEETRKRTMQVFQILQKKKDF